MNDTNESWRKLLTSRTLKSNLISISLFLTAFEMFKERVAGLPKTFSWILTSLTDIPSMNNTKRMCCQKIKAGYTLPYYGQKNWER